MRQIDRFSNKANLTIQIDADVKRLFQSRFAGQVGYLVEGFMRDILRIELPSDDKGVSEIDIEKKIEEAAKKKHLASLEIQALEMQRKEQLAKSQQEKEQREIEQKQIRILDLEEQKAVEAIELNGERIDFKLAQEKALKEGKTLTALEYLSLKGISI